MHSIKISHISDMHLGSSFASLPNEKAQIRKKEYDYTDSEGNEIEEDLSDYISVTAVRDELTGKYTLNVEILNPIEFKMNFQKTELNGRALDGKTVIEINGEEKTAIKLTIESI